MSFEIKGLDSLTSEISDLELNLRMNGMELSNRAAREGMRVAEIYYDNALKDGIDDGTFSVKRSLGGYSFVAEGKEPVFVEFGAGVYYNKSNFYPIPKPSGIKNIGEYDKGYGKRKAWGYYGQLTGMLHITHGTPMRMPMYNASKYVEENIDKIAKEVFK